MEDSDGFILVTETRPCNGIVTQPKLADELGHANVYANLNSLATLAALHKAIQEDFHVSTQQRQNWQ
jgi:hypothetical protein